MLNKVYFPLRNQIRQCGALPKTKVKPIILLDDETNELIEKEEIKPRHHPGAVLRTTTQFPKWLPKAVELSMEDHSRKPIINDAADLARFLVSRPMPPESDMVQAKYAEVRQSIEQHPKYSEMHDREVDTKIHQSTMNSLKRKIACWAPIRYDKYRGLMYVVGRGAVDYAILYKVLREIQKRDPTFQPKTLLDFGSGVGTVSWAVSDLWNKSLKERICVDVSDDMNVLAAKLEKRANPTIKGNCFYKQYLPITSVPTFDIVVSAFSLLELPNRKTRTDTIANLWRKTEKYLVLIDVGTKGGFQVMSEARDFLLHLIKVQQKNTPYDAYLFAPCPHEFSCPRINDEAPCNFEASYFEFSFGTLLRARNTTYTYLIFKKGNKKQEKESWPRIVRPVLVRSRHTICRMCTSEGRVQEIIFSKGKHKKPVYYCARGSQWGDRLPIEIINQKKSDTSEND